jgi:hypothetical protein
VAHDACKRDAQACSLQPQESVGLFSHFVCFVFGCNVV